MKDIPQHRMHVQSTHLQKLHQLIALVRQDPCMRACIQRITVRGGASYRDLGGKGAAGERRAVEDHGANSVALSAGGDRNGIFLRLRGVYGATA